MILVKACCYLNSTAKQIHLSLQCSFKLARETHSISLSCALARVVTYYTEVFSGNAAKASVFEDLGWWHTQNRKLARREEIFSEFDKKYIGLES